MSIFKAKAPFFSGSYYRELLRELRLIGIVFAVIQLIYGFAGEFGSSSNIGLLSIFTLSVGGATKIHSDVFAVYFFVCALVFFSTHLNRRSWDFRNSLPIAKRTMFVCHFAAVLTWAAVIFAANFLGAFIGEGVRLITASETIPDGFGMSAASMLRSVVSGISSYCLLVIIGSIVANAISIIVAIGIIAILPMLFSTLVSFLREYGITARELLMPLGIRGTQTAGTVASVVLMVILAVLAYIAFGKSRVETAQRAARTEWLHVLIGIGGAACVALFASILVAQNLPHRGAIYEMKEFYIRSLICGGIAMLLAYFFYMWITGRSFTKALKKCVFVPIAFIAVGLAALIAFAADKKWEKLDFSVSNIDHIRLTDDAFSNENYYYYDSYIFGSYKNSTRGSSKAYNVKITDEKLLKAASEIADNSKYTSSAGSYYGIFSAYAWIQPDNIEVVLKDGSKWAFSGNYSEILYEDAARCEEYINEFASLKRFGSAKLLVPNLRNSEIGKTLIEELNAMEPVERAKLFARTGGNHYGDYFYSGIMPEAVTQTDEDGYGYYLTIASPTYDHVAQIELSSKLPRTTELYMKLMTEKSKAHKDYDDFISVLENRKFEDIGGSFCLFEDGVMHSAVIIDVYVGDNYSEFSETSREFCTVMADCIKNGQPIEGADHVVGLDVSYIYYLLSNGEGNAAGYYSRLYDNGRAVFFAGVDAQTADKIRSLIEKFKSYSYGFDSYLQFKPEMYELINAVADGRLELYDDRGRLYTPEELEEVFYKGYQFFYDRDGNEFHIYELYDMLQSSDETTL